MNDILAQISGGKLFSKLDANSGFWKIPLAPKSRLLTTFLTPFGRYCFNKLPFGITSAPEHFQKRMSAILAGLEGVLVLIDDVLIWGKDEKEHNDRLTVALNRVSEAGVTLNGEKCKYGKTSIEFLGHLQSSEGIQADPTKISAIIQMQPPKNVSELRRFLGMTNQLGKFSPNLAEITQPLRELLSRSTVWVWGSAQESAFTRIKGELSTSQILAPYSFTAETKISADASSYMAWVQYCSKRVKAIGSPLHMHQDR